MLVEDLISPSFEKQAKRNWRPNARNQVGHDFTVVALAWMTMDPETYVNRRQAPRSHPPQDDNTRALVKGFPYAQ